MDRMEFYIDDILTNEVIPPDGGFFELGGFKRSDENLWQSGSRMAPFDAPVT